MCTYFIAWVAQLVERRSPKPEAGSSILSPRANQLKTNENNKRKNILECGTIIWQSGLCIHSGNCVKNLSAVFKPKDHPWIQPENASTQEIIETVKKCPSGALSIKE